MSAWRRVGRTIGILVLVQILVGVLVNFVLVGPVFQTPGGFAVGAAAHPLRIGLAAVIGLAGGAISVGIAILLLAHLRRQGRSLALWFLSLSVAGLALAAVEQTTVLSMLSLSKSHAGAGGTDAEEYGMLWMVVAAARNWAHHVTLIVGGGGLLVLYAALYRCSLIPRALAVFGLAAVALQLVAVTMPLFGRDVPLLLLAPLALAQLALGLWLTARGFALRRASLTAAASSPTRVSSSLSVDRGRWPQAAMRIGIRRRPQCPAGPSNTPAHAAPQLRQWPSSVS